MRRLTYILSIFLVALLALTGNAQDKDLTTDKVRFMLQGNWVSDDSTLSMTVMGDTIIERKAGNAQADHFDYTIKKETCDPELDKKAKGTKSTGFYIDESSTYDAIEFCNMLITITNDTMVLLYTDGQVVLTKKP